MPPKPIKSLDELLALIQPLIDAGCAFDMALPGGSFVSKVTYYNTMFVDTFDTKGVKTRIFL